MSKLITTPYNQVLETAHCRHTFILVKDKKFKKHLSIILGVIWRCNHPDKVLILSNFNLVVKPARVLWFEVSTAVLKSFCETHLRYVPLNALF